MEISNFQIDIDSELSQETKEIARKELRECEEIVKKAEEELRKLIEQAEDFTFPEDPYFLKIFLRPCKYYPESAFNLIKQVLMFRDKYKAIVQGLMPKDEKDTFVNYNVITILQNRDYKGRRILLIRGGGDWDPDKVSVDQMFRLLYLLHLCAMLEPETQIRGIVVMFDFKGLSMKHVVAHGPSAIFRLLTFAQNAMPLRLKEVHIVNQPFIFNMIWSIVNPLLKDKLRKRIHFHSSKMESLHKFLEPSHLPKNYAGSLPEMNYGGAEWYQSIEKYLDHFEKWNQISFKKK